MGFLQGSALLACCYPYKEAYWICVCQTVMGLSGAVMDVVVDGLMVVQQRNDPENGSENLQSFCWSFLAIGGVIGSLCGGYITEYIDPRWAYAVMAVFGFAVMTAGILMDSHLEQDSNALINASLKERSLENLRNVWKGVKLKQLWQTMLFFVILGATLPSSDTFLYYYETDVLDMSQILISWLSVISYAALFIGVSIYNGALKNVEIRYMMITACFVNMLGAAGTDRRVSPCLFFCSMLFCTREASWN